MPTDPITARYVKHTLRFLKPARTSRGEMPDHTVFYIILQQGKKKGYGEAAPLPGLSIDNAAELEQKIGECCELISDGFPTSSLQLEQFPALQFAMETALLDLENETPFVLYPNDFVKGKAIPINGLVWMDSSEEMLKQAWQKVEQGFHCIKFKVGALDFDEECRMLETFRKKFSAFKTEIRLDANGAFHEADVLEKLKDLSRFEIHSIEQPVKQGQYELMQEVCASSKIPVALDEELIGVNVFSDAEKMLGMIRPAYLILKPTLLGGFAASEQWIELAKKYQTGWWATSALESNIGLNAIAQWTSAMNAIMPQGLGTGSLYQNNIASPLDVRDGFLLYNTGKHWDIPFQ